MKMFKRHNFTSKGGLAYFAYVVECLRIWVNCFTLPTTDLRKNAWFDRRLCLSKTAKTDKLQEEDRRVCRQKELA